MEKGKQTSEFWIVLLGIAATVLPVVIEAFSQAKLGGASALAALGAGVAAGLYAWARNYRKAAHDMAKAEVTKATAGKSPAEAAAALEDLK